MKKLQALFIDWNDTLSYSKFWGHLNKERILIENYLFKENRDLVNQWMKGYFSTEEILMKISDALNLPYDFLLEEFVKSCQEMEFCDPSILDLIQKIRKLGIKVVIATDNMDSFSRFTIPSLNLHEHFDDILNSANLGCFKDDCEEGEIRFFETYLSNNNISYNEVVLLDDSPDENNIYYNACFPRILIDSPNALVLHIQKIIDNS